MAKSKKNLAKKAKKTPAPKTSKNQAGKTNKKTVASRVKDSKKVKAPTGKKNSLQESKVKRKSEGLKTSDRPVVKAKKNKIGTNKKAPTLLVKSGTLTKKKFGIFGGSFNPIHQGHVNSVVSIKRRLGLEKVIVVPTGINPLKPSTEGATAEQRLEMTRLAFQDLSQDFLVSDLEILDTKPSYTLHTIEKLEKENPEAEFYLILGMDQLRTFPLWKNPEKIIAKVHLVITSRPDYPIPKDLTELPTWFQEASHSFRFNQVQFKSGFTMQFVQLQDLEISSTEVRKMIRSKKNTAAFLPLSVEQYIREQKLYQNLDLKIADYRNFSHSILRILDEKKAIQIKGFDLTQMQQPSEYAVVASGTSTRHASSLAENLVKSIKEEYGVWPQSVEGLGEGRWVLVDYGNVIVHIFYDFVRQEYALESLWSQAAPIL